jgi:TonB-linked SusC/RagA family outer membrane protein
MYAIYSIIIINAMDDKFTLRESSHVQNDFYRILFNFKKCIILLMLLQVSFFAQAQKTVTGTVKDPKGETLIGVSVTIKGTSTGASTNVDGKFTVMVNNESDVLMFSYLGFIVQEVPVANRSDFDIILLPDAKSLEEVVVVGYGTQSKRSVTGSISSVDMTKQSDLPNTSITQAIRGRVAGVQFTDSGRPGQDGAILVRGQNSLSASNSPLIVLDGIIFNGSLSDINPNDIQTMDILKDASSASIYGSRAANGVILVTSKKGATEKATIRFNGFTGVSDEAYQIKLLTPKRYLQRILDYRTQSGLTSDPAQIASYLTKTEADNYAKGITHNPWDIASQDGRMSSYDLSVSGKSNFSNYYLSGAIADERGLVLNDNQKRHSFRANIDNKITDWLNIGVNATFVRRDLSGEAASLSDAYRASPYGTWYYPDGEPTQFSVAEEQAGLNPIRSTVLTTNEEIAENLFSSFFARVSVPFIKGLEYRVNYSPNYRWNHNYNFFRQDKYLVSNTTTASKLDQKSFDWLLENILSYKKTIGNDHTLDVTLLYGRNHNEFESTTANASQLSIDVLGFNDLSLGNFLTNSSSASASEGISSMARLNYMFKNKYIVTLTGRRDGSSVFAANNKFANFTSGSLAWIVSDEKFLKNVSFIDMMKMRVSYGSVGNQAINPYQSLGLSGITQYVYGDGGATSIGIFPSTIGNDDLKWETTYKSNAALDFEFLKGRLGGTFEVYSSTTKDLIVRRAIPSLTGFNSILTNIGEVNNRGIELTINSVNIRKSKFEWSSNVVISNNKNKIVHLFGSDTNKDGREDDVISNNWFIGKPINSYYDYVIDGIYQEGDNIPAGYKAGWIRIKDLNGDGKLDSKDRTVVGSGGNPRYRFGVSNNFRYGNLSLSIFINSMQDWISPFGMLGPGTSTTGRSLNKLDDGWWTSANKSTTRTSLVYTNPLGHNWYESRDFIRIQDVSLGYEFPRALVNKAKISNLRVFVSGKNVYTFTDWLGSDPESGGLTEGAQFPMPRSFTFGLNMGF